MNQIKKCWGGCGKSLNKEEQIPITLLNGKIEEVICSDCIFDSVFEQEPNVWIDEIRREAGEI